MQSQTSSISEGLRSRCNTSSESGEGAWRQTVHIQFEKCKHAPVRSNQGGGTPRGGKNPPPPGLGSEVENGSGFWELNKRSHPERNFRSLSRVGETICQSDFFSNFLTRKRLNALGWVAEWSTFQCGPVELGSNPRLVERFYLLKSKGRKYQGYWYGVVAMLKMPSLSST